MRAAAATSTATTATAQRGLRALCSSFSSFPFSQPAKVEKPPAAEPSTNLFVSGICVFSPFVHTLLTVLGVVPISFHGKMNSSLRKP